MIATDFIYGGNKLSELGMMICSFNGASDDTVSSGADIKFNTVSPSGSDLFKLYSADYSEVYTATFGICKNPCLLKDKDDFFWTPEQVSQIQRWLCRKDMFDTFKIIQDNYENIYWNATFSSQQVLKSGQIVGLTLTMTTDSPYAYMDEITLTYSCDSSTPVKLFDLSDEVGSIYPDMKITLLEAGDLEIKNTLDSRVTIIKKCTAGETLYLDGKALTIQSSNSSHSSLPNDFNYFYPRIINTYTENCNEYTFSKKCKTTISYSPIFKIGL